MSYFLLNIFLAIGWQIINGTFSGFYALTGFIIGFLSLWLTQPFGTKSPYFRKFFACFDLAWCFFYEMIVSVLRVALEVIRPTPASHPAILQVPLAAKSDIELTILANMVTLTPGTLTIDISKDKKHLIIHVMFGEDPTATIASIKEGFERKLLKVTRG